MKKTNNTPTLRHKITSIIGYALFGAVVLSFLLTTVVPMVSALQYTTARHANIIVLIIVFAVALILPALASYLIGDTSTNSKKETLHRYNGVLFGFAAYWVAMLMSWVGFSTVFGVSDQSFPVPLIATNVAPVVLTIFIMTILAFAFAKKQKKNTSALQYLPYQILLTFSVVGAFVAPYISEAPYVSFDGAGWLVIPAIAVGIAYAVLRNQKMSRFALLSDAIIVMTIGWVSIWIADSFVGMLQVPYPLADIPSYIIGLIVFSTYLFLRVRRR